jgi:hypothetical protein
MTNEKFEIIVQVNGGSDISKQTVTNLSMNTRTRNMKTHRMFTALILFSATFALNTASAERAPRRHEELTKSASHVVHGVVEHMYERNERKGMFKDTYILAEIVVQNVNKGEDIEVGDRVFAKFWRKTWLGPAALTPPGTYGFRPKPMLGDSVGAYLRGDRKTGFEVLHPNGFFEIEESAPKP